ncbi:hypothetical protein SK128_010610, partial [Halocaridina rubra]
PRLSVEQAKVIIGFEDMVKMGVSIVNTHGKTTVTVNESEIVARSARASVSACVLPEKNDDYIVTLREEIIES